MLLLGFDLVRSESVSSGTSRGVQGEDVLITEACNGPVQHGLAANALTEIECQFSGETVARRAAHHLHSLSNLAVGEHV